MSAARARFILLSVIVLAVPVIVWWADITAVLRGEGPAEAVPAKLEIGDKVGAFTWLNVHDEPERFDMADGKRPTVVWFWSVHCPCISDCEARIKALLARYPDDKVRFLAVDPNPHDERFEIEETRRELNATYPVYRDPEMTSVLRMRVRTSASVAVYDRHGVLRFRGAIDDDIYNPKVSYVHAALDALLDGKPIPQAESAPYGCDYGLIED